MQEVGRKKKLTSNKAKGKNISITTKVLNISQRLTNEKIGRASCRERVSPYV